MRAPPELERGFQLEGFDESHQIAFVRGSDHERMQVIGHDAISVNEEPTGWGVLLELCDEP